MKIYYLKKEINETVFSGNEIYSHDSCCSVVYDGKQYTKQRFCKINQEIYYALSSQTIIITLHV